MKNSEKFIEHFNEIERYLRKYSKQQDSHSSSFSSLLDTSKDPVIRKFSHDLKQFGMLRNAIVHDKKGGAVIAEPNDKAVNDLGLIRNLLFDPPKISAFRRSVSFIEADDCISEALAKMKDGDYSQIPVYKDRAVCAVLTSQTIARWLSYEVKNELVSLLDTKIKDVLKCAEYDENFRMLSKQTTIFEALSYFDSSINDGRPIQAILITENGKSSEALLGIMTVTDFPDAHKKISS